MQFHFIYIGLDLLHFCVKVCYAERSEANGFYIKKNAVVLNEVKLAFVRSAATLYHFHSVLFWFCGFCSVFVRSTATLLSFSLGFVASKARLFLFCLCGAKRPFIIFPGLVERSDLLLLFCFCGAKRLNHFPSDWWSEATG